MLKETKRLLGKVDYITPLKEALKLYNNANNDKDKTLYYNVIVELCGKIKNKGKR